MHRLNSERGQRGCGHSSVGTAKALSPASVRQPWVFPQHYKGVCQGRLGLLVMTRQDNQGAVWSKFPRLAQGSLFPFFLLQSNAYISVSTANGWNLWTEDVKIFSSVTEPGSATLGASAPSISGTVSCFPRSDSSVPPTCKEQPTGESWQCFYCRLLPISYKCDLAFHKLP